MKFIKLLGITNALLLLLCVLIIIVSEYLFFTGDQLHGIFVGIWAPMLVGLMIFFKLFRLGCRLAKRIFQVYHL
jgi:Flp pilus assembly protein protease CpaA